MVLQEDLGLKEQLHLGELVMIELVGSHKSFE